ncbi:MAG: hypothetical protein IJP66_04010 [Kiritimatiellae bacterium]|nr:hypothetical protein [Kiritimatiellia bacterium]
MKTSRTIFCAATITFLAVLHTKAEWSNGEIAKFYEDTTSNMLCRIDTWKGRTFAEIRASYLTLAVLRSRRVKGLAMENLSFGPTGFYKTDALPFDPVLPAHPYMGFAVGRDSVILTKCPAFFALQNSCLSFVEIKALMTNKSVNSWFVPQSIIATLSTYTGGNYAKHTLETDGSVPEDFAKKCMAASIDFLPCEYIAQKGNGEGLDDIAETFWRMEDDLRSRFLSLLSNPAHIDEHKKQLLADTIRTMGFIRSLRAIPVLEENLTVCPRVSTNTPGGYVFPAAEALIEIGPAIGHCFNRLDKAAPLSLEESLWLRISHELYPEGLEYDLMRRAETNDTRAARLLDALPWRRLAEDFSLIDRK